MKQRWIIPVVLLWLTAVGIGTVWLLRSKAVSGSVGAVPTLWPEDMALPGKGHRPTFVMFAHPRCPCTRASIGELARLLAQCPGRVDAHVYFFRPDSDQSDWQMTDIWRSTVAFPGVTVSWDLEGALARRFGAKTSGHALLYDPSGRLLYSGGLTAARGHAGDNSCRDAALNAVTTSVAGEMQRPVFGCSLLDPQPGT